MSGLYHYKVWNPNLCQFVAQPDLRTEDDIQALGGVIIADCGPPAPPLRQPYSGRSSAGAPQLTASH